MKWISKLFGLNKRTKSTGFSSKIWTKEDDETLLLMTANRAKPHIIAKALNRTVQSIYSRRNKLKATHATL